MLWIESGEGWHMTEASNKEETELEIIPGSNGMVCQGCLSVRHP
jgi:hypothetical protein